MSFPRLAHCRIFGAPSAIPIPSRAVQGCSQTRFCLQILAWQDPDSAPGPPSGPGQSQDWGARRLLRKFAALPGLVIPSRVSVGVAGIAALDSAGALVLAGPGLAIGIGLDLAPTDTRPTITSTLITTPTTMVRLLMIPRLRKITRSMIRVRQAYRVHRIQVALKIPRRPFSSI